MHTQHIYIVRFKNRTRETVNCILGQTYQPRDQSFLPPGVSFASCDGETPNGCHRL